MFTTSASLSSRPDGELDYYTEAELFERFLGCAPDAANSKRGLVAIASGAATLAIVFPTPFASLPTNIQVRIRMPSGAGRTIPVVVDHSTVAAEGFTALLSGPPADSDHQLEWWALL